MEQSESRIKFSLPESQDWCCGYLESVSDESLANVTIASFNGSTQNFKLRQVPNVFFDEPSSDVAEAGNMSRAEYESLVEKAISASKTYLDKVVVSRVVDIENTQLDIEQSLKQLRAAFPRAFVYAFMSPGLGFWMGATPEILVQNHEHIYSTVALAGTRWGDDPFTTKELREQQIVVDTLLNDLDLTSDNASIAREIWFGEIRHLQTDIHWKSETSLAEISKKLHPTPAVCGIPKNEATQFILNNEGYNRELYTGYIKLENVAQVNASFVNLRCMQLFRDRIRFYVGGGINSMSKAETEWIETERKLQTILKAMNIER